MKLNQLFFLSIIMLLCATACNNNSSKPTEEATAKADSNTTVTQLVFDKLVGTWQNEDGKGFERWTKNEDGTYKSVGFSVKGTDTSWNEQANIYPENNNWVFDNLVKGQNNGKSVKFTSSQLSENNVQFSNPAHDFPTDINYTLPNANTINAFIIGPNDKGGKDTIPFNFKRLKQ
jgi:hypothetical protein